jgi:glutamate-1-semialdehyde 2,1-aminomutase
MRADTPPSGESMCTFSNVALALALAVAAPWLGRRAWRRLELSRAKHPSLAGHAKLSRRLAALLPYYGYGRTAILRVRRAPPDVAARRRAGFERLCAELGSCAAPRRSGSATR